jgi:hypothetical protein
MKAGLDVNHIRPERSGATSVQDGRFWQTHGIRGGWKIQPAPNFQSNIWPGLLPLKSLARSGRNFRRFGPELPAWRESHFFLLNQQQCSFLLTFHFHQMQRSYTQFKGTKYKTKTKGGSSSIVLKLIPTHLSTYGKILIQVL